MRNHGLDKQMESSFQNKRQVNEKRAKIKEGFRNPFVFCSEATLS